MKQVLQYDREKSVRVEQIPSPQMKHIGVLVDNRCSLISVGTEKTMINLSQMSLVGKARQRPDAVKQVIEKVKSEGLMSTYNKVMGRLKTPLPLGYSSAGVVREVHNTVNRFTVGDRVACAGFGYASHAESVFIPGNLAVKIPDNVSFEEASFVTLGAIALQGVRIADPRLGETVAVIGLGLLGQITAMLLAASGCRVIGTDVDPAKVEQGKQSGCDHTFMSDNSLHEKILNLTSGHGVDSVIITAATDSAAPVITAGEICREKGSVVVVGAVKMDVPRNAYYEKELSLKLSRSYGPGRYDYNYEEANNDYPFGYVRWTENRNMSAFLDMISRGRIDIKHLITHRFDISQAEHAYDLISGNTDESFTGVVLTYPENQTLETIKIGPRIPMKGANPQSIGFIGAGGFATGVLLPKMKQITEYNLTSVTSGSGISASNATGRFGFENAVDTAKEIMTDTNIGTVFIANRHNQHAELVIDALEHNKNVFVEKPLCMTANELREIITTYNRHPQILMVGFNRRFAPQIQKLKKSLKNRNYPLSMHYRINGGFIPSNTWVQDEHSGGGRIIGEACHFIDLLSYITGSTVTKVSAESLAMPDERYRSDDNLQITLRFADGSVGTINYVASGNTRMNKEYLEVFGDGKAFTVDDFKTMSAAVDNKLTFDKARSQDKGHKAMLQQFARALKTTSESPIPFTAIVNSTLATLAVLDSLATGEAQWLSD